ncbi:hypothetical protein GGI15_002248 [Coemansia interrupta]|uniref:Uncharacterized protein n=1 Tax=Coemansia interrupta TaxID=1126814 RepID=A0A9W8HG15_9FUNG|nr:hypothetical protein GGI15_002248 [Coemansia interrupta]
MPRPTTRRAAAKAQQSVAEQAEPKIEPEKENVTRLRSHRRSSAATSKAEPTSPARPQAESPGSVHSPKPGTPKYGRRTSLGSPARRSLVFATPSPARLSHNATALFDDLVDNFSPIKRGPPPDDEDADDDLVSVDLDAVPEYSDHDGDRNEKTPDANDDSDEFDIDRIVGAGSTRSKTRKRSARDLLDHQPAALADHLPKRNRTLKSSPNAASSKKTTARPKTKPKPRSKPLLQRQQRRRADTTTTTNAAAAAAASADKKPAASSTKHFDDIDDFQLVEETV